jgi:hypothetical protein
VEQAGKAMSATMHEMADQLAKAADPRAWTQEHPWYSVGAAAILGFMAASALTPARGESFKERLEELFPEHPAPPPEPAHAPKAAPGQPNSQKPSHMSSIMGHLVDAVKTALVSTISSAVTAKVHQDGPPQPSSATSVDPTAPVG